MDKKFAQQFARMKDLYTYGKVNEEANAPKNYALEYHAKAADGKTYGIIRECNKYYIKQAEAGKELVAESYKYLGGFNNKKDYEYHSYSKALQQFEYKMNSINEAHDANVNISTLNPFRANVVLAEGTEKMQNELARVRQIMYNTSMLMNESTEIGATPIKNQPEAEHANSGDEDTPFTSSVKADMTFDGKKSSCPKCEGEPFDKGEKGEKAECGKDVQVKNSVAGMKPTGGKVVRVNEGVDEDMFNAGLPGAAGTGDPQSKKFVDGAKTVNEEDEDDDVMDVDSDYNDESEEGFDAENDEFEEEDDFDGEDLGDEDDMDGEELGDEDLDMSEDDFDDDDMDGEVDEEDPESVKAEIERLQAVLSDIEGGNDEFGGESDDEGFEGESDDDFDMSDDEDFDAINEMVDKEFDSYDGLLPDVEADDTESLGSEEPDVEDYGQNGEIDMDDYEFNQRSHEGDFDDEDWDFKNNFGGDMGFRDSELDYSEEGDDNWEDDGSIGGEETLSEAKNRYMNSIVNSVVKSIKEEKLNVFGKHPGYRKKPMDLPATGEDKNQWGEDWNDSSVYSEEPFGSKIGSSMPFDKAVEKITDMVMETLKKK